MKISKLPAHSTFFVMLLTTLFLNLTCSNLSMAEDTASKEEEAAAIASGRANIKIKGMHCEDCNQAIVTQIKKVEGVRSVAADFKSGSAQVTFDAGTSMQEISKAVQKAGYEVLEIHPG